ncbi:hypothetical protein M8C21_027749 [Ambrosia artemisiifolia]|uniref:Uncharacterized protein n=1 Tax=Ambrosia artemisiifolia TaxID=4212 RepID=A0AAD5G959_AMBAR|nr:hypothetical protein M8C21_027749 [Ambrosia artemisiifolia]
MALSSSETSKWLTLSITLTLATISASAAVYFWTKRRQDDSNQKLINDLQKSLNESLKKCSAERQGRIRAQQIDTCRRAPTTGRYLIEYEKIARLPPREV